MSWVQSVVVLAAIDELDVVKISDALGNLQCGREVTFSELGDFAGGIKGLEFDLFAFATNGVEVPDILDAIASGIPTEDRDDDYGFVQALIQNDNDDFGPTMYRRNRGGWSVVGDGRE